MLFRFNLPLEHERNTIGDVIQPGPFGGFIRQHDTEENGRLACPIGAKLVPDADNGMRQGMRGPLHRRINLVLVDDRNDRHKPIIARSRLNEPKALEFAGADPKQVVESGIR